MHLSTRPSLCVVSVPSWCEPRHGHLLDQGTVVAAVWSCVLRATVQRLSLVCVYTISHTPFTFTPHPLQCIGPNRATGNVTSSETTCMANCANRYLDAQTLCFTKLGELLKG